MSILRGFHGRFAKRGGSRKYKEQQKLEALTMLKAIQLKIKNGEMVVETSGFWQGANKDQWIFRIILKESEIPVLSEEIQEKK